MKKVGILRGGEGEHYESSLREGGEVLAHILENLSDKYKPVDILVDKNGVWHLQGVPITPASLMHQVDVVWDTSHPSHSAILENFSIPHVGAGHFSRVLEESRAMLEEHMKGIGVNMPRHIILSLYQEDFDGPKGKYAIKKAKEVHAKFGAPWMVKSLTPDLSIGVHVANTFPELINAIEDVVAHERSILVEELIAGKEASMHSVSGFRNEDIYIFPPLGMSTQEKDKLINLAKDLHVHLCANHYLNSQFVLHPKRGIFLTAIDFSPNLKKDSAFHQACQSVGAKMHQVIEHILERAL